MKLIFWPRALVNEANESDQTLNTLKIIDSVGSVDTRSELLPIEILEETAHHECTMLKRRLKDDAKFARSFLWN